MNTLLQDLLYGLRLLRKSPGYTAVAVMSLALSIGAGTAIFSLVNAILLSSLPVPNPQALRVIQWTGAEPQVRNFTGATFEPGEDRRGGDSVAYPIFEAVRESCVEEADVFGYALLDGFTIRVQHEPFIAEGLMVTDNFFSGLGVKPWIGRLFEPNSTAEADALGVVITHPWWERYFESDPGALGQPLTISGHTFTVIGVLPPGFPGVHPGAETEFYVSMAAQPQLMPNWPPTSNGHWWIAMMARLKPKTQEPHFAAVFETTFARAVGDFLKEPRIVMTDGRAGPTGQKDYYRQPLLLLLGAVGVVILTACANLAGLMLVQGAARLPEYSVRAAIGAGRRRLFRQTLTENLLLSLAGAAIGLLLAMWIKDSVARLLAGTADGLQYDTSLDMRVLGFTVAVSVLTTLLAGLIPAWRAASVDPQAGLKERATLGSARLRTGRILVTAQVALSLLLLSGAGLYVRSLVNLVSIHPGFDMENLLLFQIKPRSAGYNGQQATRLNEQVQTMLTTIPGVRSAALSQYALLGGWMSGGGFFSLPGHPKLSAEGVERPKAHRIAVGESFFSTMEIPLRLGRSFTAEDTDTTQKVVVVNETFARKYLGKEDPIGQILNADGSNWHIIGVCADAKYTDIKTEVPPTVYFTFRQDGIGETFFAVRTALPPATLMGSIRRSLAAIAPDVPIARVTTQRQVRDDKISRERMFAFFCGSLALLAVLLSCIGVYGLMAYNVARRTGEIGIRMALGATRRHIARPILGEALAMAGVGVVLGGFGAWAAARLIQSQLYEVSPHDPATFAAAVMFLLVVALLAAYLPARRAARVNPTEALRSE